MPTPSDLLDRLSSLPNLETGLTASDVETLRARYGDNRIVEPPRHRFWHALRDAAGDPMLWFLLVVSALFFATGETVEAAVLLLAILPLLGMDAFLHRRTRLSTAALASRLASEAQVLREGEWRTVPAAELVPGDRVRVGSGEAIPADGLWCAAEALQVDESSLSGESVPVRKQIAEGATVVSECWGFAGTRVLAGRGELQLLGTGGDSRYGELVRLAVTAPQPRTPLQQAVGRLVLQLVWIALALCLLLAAVRLWQGQGWLDAVLSGLTLAIAALPEEFPVVLSLFLGVGVFRLARRNALVRRAVAVEDIGRVSVLCTDKTGTLTEGRLRLRELRPSTGLSPEELAMRAAQSVAIDSTDPLDVCLREAAASAPALDVRQRFPFTEERRRETGLLVDGEAAIARMKGAPETVLRSCSIEASEAAHWQAEAQALAARGLKVLGLAERAIGGSGAADVEPDAGFRMLGLLGFGDPLRSGVADAVARCRAQGLRVVMLTGDHPATAAAIAVEAGLCAGPPRVVSLDDNISAEALAQADVVARAQPKQKLALVQALQASGAAVAVEDIGRVSVLCTDKTGTLTEGRLRLRELRPSADLSAEDLAMRAAQSVAIDSTDPLDVCLREAAASAPALAVRQRFPFTEDRRRETLLLIHGEAAIARMKGAPETVLRSCSIEASEAAHWQAEAQALAARGLKVLGLAERAIGGSGAADVEPDAGFRMLGLLGFGDPLRSGVADAVARCRAQGLRVVMLTGDHPATAAAIAIEAGLCAGAPRVVSLDDNISAEALAQADVVARAQPKQKLALVQALQASGAAVAVTGDGVNDVPALKAADVGIAMGERGTQAARESASIVLLDDDFATLAGAIAEGRALYRNLRASFAYLLLVHLPFVLSAALVPAFGGPLLFLPIHIVWLELIIHPSAMLGFQREAADGDGGAPTRAGQMFDGRNWWRLLLGGGFGCAAVLLAQALPGGFAPGDSDSAHRALALAALVTFSALVLSGLGRNRSARLIAALSVASLALTLWPAASGVLGTTAPAFAPLLVALALGAIAAMAALALQPLGRARAA